jgi:hypothetical protein
MKKKQINDVSTRQPLNTFLFLHIIIHEQTGQQPIYKAVNKRPSSTMMRDSIFISKTL